MAQKILHFVVPNLKYWEYSVVKEFITFFFFHIPNLESVVFLLILFQYQRNIPHYSFFFFNLFFLSLRELKSLSI